MRICLRNVFIFLRFFLGNTCVTFALFFAFFMTDGCAFATSARLACFHTARSAFELPM